MNAQNMKTLIKYNQISLYQCLIYNHSLEKRLIHMREPYTHAIAGRFSLGIRFGLVYLGALVFNFVGDACSVL